MLEEDVKLIEKHFITPISYSQSVNMAWKRIKKALIGSGQNSAELTQGLIDKLDWNLSQEEFDLTVEYFNNSLPSGETNTTKVIICPVTAMSCSHATIQCACKLTVGSCHHLEQAKQ